MTKSQEDLSFSFGLAAALSAFIMIHIFYPAQDHAPPVMPKGATVTADIGEDSHDAWATDIVALDYDLEYDFVDSKTDLAAECVTGTIVSTDDSDTLDLCVDGVTIEWTPDYTTSGEITDVEINVITCGLSDVSHITPGNRFNCLQDMGEGPLPFACERGKKVTYCDHRPGTTDHLEMAWYHFENE